MQNRLRIDVGLGFTWTHTSWANANVERYTYLRISVCRSVQNGCRRAISHIESRNGFIIIVRCVRRDLECARL